MNGKLLVGIILVVAALAVLVIAAALSSNNNASSSTLSNISQYVNETPTGDNITAYAENAILAAGYLPDSMAFISDQQDGPSNEGGFNMTMHSVVVNCTVAGQVHPAYEVIEENNYTNGTRTLQLLQGDMDINLTTKYGGYDFLHGTMRPTGPS
jgi:hypothetical protein